MVINQGNPENQCNPDTCTKRTQSSHIHVYYQDVNASIGIVDCKVLKGKLPSKQSRLVNAWIEIHRDELMANWKLCQNRELPLKIKPLK